MITTKLTLFGAPRIERDGHTVHIDTRKAFALIAYLVTQRGYQSRDSLAALLWQDNDEAGARGALRRTLSALNAALNGRGLLIEREVIAFDAAALWCDVTAFTEALSACESHDHDARGVCGECLPRLNEAVALYRGDFLQGFTLRDSSEFDLWQVQQSEYFRSLYASALEKLIQLYAEKNHMQRAISLAQRWLALDPLHEAAHGVLMRLYAASGQRSLALRQYHECVRILEQELGVPPLAETTAVYQQVLNDTSAAHIIRDLPMIHEGRASSAADVLPFIGREALFETLNKVYSQRFARGNIVVIEGEAGIGKSRLVAQFSTPRQSAGAQVMRLHAFESESQFAYAPLIRALREHIRRDEGCLSGLAPHWHDELARLLPEIQPARTAAMNSTPDAGLQTRLYEALSQTVTAVLAGNARGILVLDDAQWVDSATLDWLTYWLRRPIEGAVEADVLVVLIWRSEEVGRGHRLRRLLTEIDRQENRVLWLTLPRLTQSQIAQIMAESTIAADERTLQKLVEESEGLPLFIHEYVKLLSAGSALSGERSGQIPTSIQHLFQSRVAQVSPIAMQILQAAAVIGRTFDLDLVQECSGRSDAETVDSAEELERRGLWQEVGGENSCAFYHDKIRAWIYEEMSLGRKRLLHRRLAQAALNRVGTTDKRAASAAFIARHFHLGGQEASAAEHYFMAGCHARTLFANLEALHYFEHSLALGTTHAVDLYQQIGDVQTMLGRYHAAIASYETGIARAIPDRIITLETGLGRVYARLGDYVSAERCFQSALDLVPSGAYHQRVMLLTESSLVHFRMGNSAHSAHLANMALVDAEASEQSLAEAQATNILGILARHQGDYLRALNLLERSTALARTVDEPSAQVAAHNNLALTCMDVGDYARAHHLWEEALEVSLKYGDRHHAAALHNHLSDLFHVMGRHELAMDHLKRAVTLFAQIGIDGTELQPEVWKLTEW
jgi:DNA-binding SARP family transcriptional activator